MPNAGRYHMNNNVDNATLSIRNFSFSANDTTSFITAARYGRVLPLDLSVTSSPQQHVSSPNTTLLYSYHTNFARNSSSNVVGSHFANDTTSFIAATRYGRALPLGSSVTSSQQQHMSSPNTTLLSSCHANMARNSSSNFVGSHSANDTTPFITATRYGRALPLGSSVTNSPQQHMSSPNTTLLSSNHANLARNSSSNVVGSQGYANWSRNASRPIFQNQRNFRYLPYREGSNRRNNSFLFNNFNLRPSGNTNRFHSLNDGSIPSATPPPFYPINNNNLNMFLSSGNANQDATRDTSTSHRVFHIRDSEARNRSMTPLENGFEALQTEKKELLLFKDDKNTIPTSPMTEGDDANENDDEHLDLRLYF
ncbi:hypothetical protein MtrunA17_Chr6g0460781 [Medicago truncatula]|uniref:Uncharacterized protein n=1 Tax=Medicago truncatula TaxID=3880 RepID=A0A396HBN6_MEDTR|nr:hypothetical protein MtrunA17_Chr6g0460781 [Medicago truncatula]